LARHGVASVVAEDRLRRTRQLLWSGIAVFVLGVAWDGIWHSRNPQALETGWRLLEAHGIMYAGTIVALGGGVFAFRGRRAPPVASWYGLATGGALAQLVGSAWDAWAHAGGGEAAVAHLVSRVGLLALLAGAIAASVQARRSG